MLGIGIKYFFNGSFIKKLTIGTDPEDEIEVGKRSPRSGQRVFAGHL